METSLSVQNDAILKKAKWWILSALVLGPITKSFSLWIFNILYNFLEYSSEELEWLNDFYFICYHITVWLTPILCFIGGIVLLKHSVKTVRVFSKVLIIFSVTNILFGIMDMFVWMELLKVFFGKNHDITIWSHRIIPTTEIFISQFILLVGFGVLWRNKQIREDYATIISLFALLIFVEFVITIPDVMWSIRVSFDFNNEMYRYLNYLLGYGWCIPHTISIVSQILIIYCYCKLLKTPSAMPVEDTEPYSYRPTKIEIGFLFAVCLFVGLIFLSFLIV